MSATTITQTDLKDQEPKAKPPAPAAPAPRREKLSEAQRACRKAEIGQNVWWYEGADIRPSTRRGATILRVNDSTVDLLIYEPGGKGFYPGGTKSNVKNACDPTVANFERVQTGVWDFTDRTKLLFDQFPTPYCEG